MKIKIQSMSRNMIVSFICRIINIVTGLMVQREILVAYGSAYNGLTSSITQVTSYLVLLEAGLGAASIQALYKPLNDKDWNRISSVNNATQISYLRVGAMFGGLLVGASLLVPLAVAGQVDFLIAGVLTLITGGCHVCTYLIGGKNTALLQADRKAYITNAYSEIANILSAILRIVALRMGCGILLV